MLGVIPPRGEELGYLYPNSRPLLVRAAAAFGWFSFLGALAFLGYEKSPQAEGRRAWPLAVSWSAGWGESRAPTASTAAPSQ